MDILYIFSIIILTTLLALILVTYTKFSAGIKKIKNQQTVLFRQIQNLASIAGEYTANYCEAIPELQVIKLKETVAKLKSVSLNKKCEISEDIIKQMYEISLVNENEKQLADNKRYLLLIDEISSCESALLYNKEQYNVSVEGYNSLIKKMPYKIISSVFSYNKYEKINI